MAAIKAGIITPTTKEMLIQTEAEHEKNRQSLYVPPPKLDMLVTALPKVMNGSPTT